MKHVVDLRDPPLGSLTFQLHADHATRDPWISGWIAAGKVFDPHILKVLAGLLRQGDRFINVGANLGWFTVIGSRLVGRTGRVYAIEPEPENYRLLLSNIAENDCTNVRTWQCAAGPRSTHALLSRSSENRGDHRVAAEPISADVVRVAVKPVDRLLWPRRRADVLLMDTQGSELAVLRGMPALLRRNPRMRVIFEYWPLGLQSCGSSAADLAPVIGDGGRRVWLLEGDGRVNEIAVADIASLALGRFAPDTGLHADMVALAPDDTDGIAFMTSLQSG